MKNTSRRLFLVAGSAAAGFCSLRVVAAATCAESPATSCLAQEFEAAWREERALLDAYPDMPEMDKAWEAAYDPASDKTSAIVERIIADPSCDLEALKLKARAYLWCNGNDVEEALGVIFDRAETTDWRLLHAILRDLLAISV